MRIQICLLACSLALTVLAGCNNPVSRDRVASAESNTAAPIVLPQVIIVAKRLTAEEKVRMRREDAAMLASADQN